MDGIDHVQLPSHYPWVVSAIVVITTWLLGWFSKYGVDAWIKYRKQVSDELMTLAKIKDSEYKDVIKKYSSRISELEANIVTLNEQLSKALKDLAECEARRGAITARIDSIIDDYVFLRGVVDRLNSDISHCRNFVNDLIGKLYGDK